MKKPNCKLTGENGNIFNLIAIAKKVMFKNDMKEEFKEMSNKIYASKSYEEALSIIGEYVNII